MRSETARLAILAAAAGIVSERGYDHLSMEGVAAAAHVGKQTIYRWWPSKSALVADCLVEGMLIPEWIEPANTGDLRADIRSWLSELVSFVNQPGNTSLVRSLVIAGAENEDVALRLSERLGIFALLGDRASATSSEFAEALLGAVIVRVLRGGPLDEAFAEQLTEVVVPGR